MIPESRLAQTPEQTLFVLDRERAQLDRERAQLQELRSFTFGVVATAMLVFLGVPLVTFALLAASIASPVLALVAVFTLARMDRSRARVQRVSPLARA